MKTLTIKDIAKICNVGISTVSRAINDDPGINENTKKRILSVIEEYHYVPNNSARNLKMTESKIVALLIKGIDNQFFQGMLKSFEKELKKRGYNFLIHAVSEDQDDISIAVELAKEKRLSGIVFLGGLMDYPEKRMKSIGIPYVLCTVAVNVNVPKRNCNSVSINDQKESYRIVDYLCKKGHKRIAIISGREADFAVGHMRLEGYRLALQDNGIECDQNLIRPMKDGIPEYSAANGYAVTKELIESGEKFTAIYAISDIVALGAYKAIFDAGKRIPDDYSVVGFDGTELSSYFNPALTTMAQPCEKMVEASVQLLMEEIDGEYKKRQLFFEAELQERASVMMIGEEKENKVED